MKSVLRLLFLGVLGLLSLAACAPAAVSPTPTSEAAGGAPAAPERQVVGSNSDIFPPQDLSAIGTTGRPQFLNSYANW